MATKTRIFIKVPHDLFKLTTADEDSGFGGSVGADLRAAIRLSRATAATERGVHLQNRIFMKASCHPIQHPSADTILNGFTPKEPFEIGQNYLGDLVPHRDKSGANVRGD